MPELFGSAFSIFVLRQFFLTLPLELDEAAEVDGANLWTILWRIVAPLSKPAIATVAVFSFINHWNDFVQPLIYLQTPGVADAGGRHPLVQRTRSAPSSIC